MFLFVNFLCAIISLQVVVWISHLMKGAVVASICLCIHCAIIYFDLCSTDAPSDDSKLLRCDHLDMWSLNFISVCVKYSLCYFLILTLAVSMFHLTTAN